MLLHLMREERSRPYAEKFLKSLDLYNLCSKPSYLVEDGKMQAQLLHIEDVEQTITTWGPKKNRKNSSSCHRILYFRDCGTGKVFCVLAKTKEHYSRMVHRTAHVGSYVVLAQPGRSAGTTMRGVPVLTYDDYLWPLEAAAANPNVEVTDFNPFSPFSVFSVTVPSEKFRFRQLKMVINCDCKGDVCLCPDTWLYPVYALSLRIALDLEGVEVEDIHPYRSMSFTRKFVCNRISGSPTPEEMLVWSQELKKRIESVEGGFRISGWAATSQFEDQVYDVLLEGGVHIASVEPLGEVTAGVWERDRSPKPAGGGSASKSGGTVAERGESRSPGGTTGNGKVAEGGERPNPGGTPGPVFVFGKK